MFEQFEIEDSLIIENRNSMKMKIEGMNSNIFTVKEEQQHEINCSDIR